MFRESTLTTITGGLIAGAAYMVGGIDQFVTTFTIFMICDYLTGLMYAAGTGSISSSVGYRGIMKKVGMIITVIVANRVDLITQPDSHAMRFAVLFFWIGIEGVSILENLGHLGLPIPAFLMNTLAKLKEKKVM